MTVEQLFIQTNTAYRGSDDDAPTTGVDFDLWLETANRKVSEWARDGKVTWQSLFDIKPAGILTAGVQSYPLDATVLIPSDKVVVTTSEQAIDYTLCKPQERELFTNACYINGTNPQKLNFFEPITNGTTAIGGTISLAGYYLPPALVDASSVVVVDDPYWLVYALASELAFNDLTYEAKYVDLNTKANNLYQQMVSNNRRGTSNNPRTARNAAYRILDPRSERTYGA